MKDIIDKWNKYLNEISVRHSSPKEPFLEDFIDRYKDWFDVHLLDLHSRDIYNSRKRINKENQTRVRLTLKDDSELVQRDLDWREVNVPELQQDIEKLANSYGWHINSFDARTAWIDIAFLKIFTNKMYKEEMLANGIKIAYHVTDERNLESILKNGLNPATNSPSKSRHLARYPSRIYLLIGSEESAKEEAEILAFNLGFSPTKNKLVTNDKAVFLKLDIECMSNETIFYNDDEFEQQKEIGTEGAVFVTTTIPPECIIGIDYLTKELK